MIRNLLHTKRPVQVALCVPVPYQNLLCLLVACLLSAAVYGFQQPDPKPARDSITRPASALKRPWPGRLIVTMPPPDATEVLVQPVKDTVGNNSAFLRKLFSGYVGTPYVDFDLKYLIKFNEYEAFRLGMGATTNDMFSKRLRLTAYGVYGTRDKDFKYGFSAAYNTQPQKSAWLGGEYIDDLVETGSEKFISQGRQFYLFEPRLFNINLFHRTRRITGYYTRDISTLLNTKIQVSLIDVEPTYDYTYAGELQDYDKYQTSTATVAFSWQPNDKVFFDRIGRATVKPGYPRFNFQAIQSVKGVLKSDFNFTKIQFQADQQWFLPGSHTLQIKALAAAAYGELPLTELFHVFPNQPNRSPLMSRFSVAGIDSFETMYYNEFFSDHFLSLQAKHFFPSWSISKLMNPQLVLITRFAWGDIKEPERHVQVNFNSLDQGYLESGFEINGILAGFGLNLMYRYGPYHLEGFENNLSFKFTFYLKNGS